MNPILPLQFKQLASPGTVPDNIAVIECYLAISLIFIFDLISGTAVSFQLLYVLPLILIALHSPKNSWVVGAVVLSIVLQMGELFFFQQQVLANLVDGVYFSATIYGTYHLPLA